MTTVTTTTNEKCVELKNIKYKTMLLSGNVLKEMKSSSSDDLTNLDKFLEDNKTNSLNEPWSKLDKTIKTKKLILYAESYSKNNTFNPEEELLLVAFLKDCLDRKKLQRVKDVLYDKETGKIKSIPALTFAKANNHFTLKNMDKRVSTIKSLTPKKNNTLKNKEVSDDEV